MVSIAQKHLCVPLTPTKHHPSAHAASGFVSLLMEDKKTLMEGALKWKFFQGYLCPGEKRGQFLCSLSSSGGMWCSHILTPAPLKPPGIVTPNC